MSATNIKTIKLAKLLPDPENVNQHNTLNIEQIKASIVRFGFLDPIGVVADPASPGKFTIVEGHGRYEAATELGMSELPCLVLTMTEAHRKGYAIAHNQTQQISMIDHRAVALEFDRLEVDPTDYVSIGYTEEDVLFLPGMADTLGSPPATHSHYHAGESAEGEEAQNEEAADPDDPNAFPPHFVPTVHRTGLTFASDASYNRFVHILTQLRGRYPDAATIGERIIRLLGDMGAEVPSQEAASE